MTWGKADDQLHDHPKAEKAGLDAMGLWVLAMSYACDKLTDGFVTRERIHKLAGGRARGDKLALRLCTAKKAPDGAGLWHPAAEPCQNVDCDKYRRDEDGFRFHDWEDYQPTAEEVQAERARKKKNLDAYRARRRGAETGHATGGEIDFDAGLKPGGNHGPVPVPVPVPDPDPQDRDRRSSGIRDLPAPPAPGLPGIEPPRGPHAADPRIAAVGAYWASRSYHPGHVTLTDLRARKIAARLAESFTVDDLKAAIDGAGLDPWLMGEDPKTAGKAYRGLETLLRDAGQVERLRDLWRAMNPIVLPYRPPPPEPPPVIKPLPGGPRTLEQMLGSEDAAALANGALPIAERSQG